MLPALLGLMAPVVAVKALTQLARAAGAALRSATARVALPVPTNAEKAAEGFSDNSDSPVIFAYDGYGRRIKIAEFDNGTLTSKKLYWWLGGEIVCERDGIAPGFPLTKRYFGQGVVVGGEKLYYTMDQLGSVRELVDSSGVVRADYRYSTYGERTKVDGDLDSDWGYAGLFHHGPSGLDLATYRTYDSKMGRWISRDPLGEGVDYNLYRYCGNNPISRIDPSGLVLGDVIVGGLRSVGGRLAEAGRAFGGIVDTISKAPQAAPPPAGTVPAAIPLAVIGWSMANANPHMGGDTTGSDRFDARRDRQQEIEAAGRRREGSGRGRQNLQRNYIMEEMQKNKPCGQSECDWLLEKLAEIQKQIQSNPNDQALRNKKRDYDQHYTDRCRGWRS